MHSTPLRPVLKLLPLPYAADSLQYFHTIAAQLPMPLILQSDIDAHNATVNTSTRGRFDIITAAPEFWLQTKNSQIDWRGSLPSTIKKTQGHSFAALHAVVTDMLMADIDYSAAIQQELPFCGGLIGYCAYDLTREYIPLASIPKNDIDVPDMQFGFYAWACIQDHKNKKSWLTLHPHCNKNLAQSLPQYLLASTHKKNDKDASAFLSADFSSNITKQEYSQKFSTIQEYIHAGDCYQINFAQRFSTKTTRRDIDIYQHLRKVMPSPFCAYLPIYNNKDSAILSFSPERFVQLRTDGTATSQPIKGTASRKRDTQEDQQAALMLENDPKNRAENLMIVDLLRNDFGKVCEIGSVSVKKLFELQTFSNVHHLVSTIEGKLKQKYNGADLLQACFPGGSITGAPKVRAMQIIDELELSRRSVYCGSIVMYSAHGAMDSNIMIRTLLLANGELFCWGGGGIVADSNCESEYQESLTKIQTLLNALQENNRQ